MFVLLFCSIHWAQEKECVLYILDRWISFKLLM